MANNKIELKQILRTAFHKIRDAYLWQRVAIFLGWTLVFYAVMWRFVPANNPMFSFWLLMLVALFFWASLGVFRRPKTRFEGKKPMRPIWQRFLTFALVLVLAFPITVLLGSQLALAVKPYSAVELAEQEARFAAEEKAEKVRLAAEQAKAEAEAKAEADQAAADKAAAEEQARKDALKKEAEAKAAEEAETDAVSTTYDKNSQPLLYAQEYCNSTVFGGSGIQTYLQTSEDGSTMFLSTNSAEDVYGVMTLICVAEALEFSEPFRASIDSTNALMGTKTWSENKIDYEWAYHPEVGLSMSIIRQQECFLGFCNY